MSRTTKSPHLPKKPRTLAALILALALSLTVFSAVGYAEPAADASADQASNAATEPIIGGLTDQGAQADSKVAKNAWDYRNLLDRATVFPDSFDLRAVPVDTDFDGTADTVINYVTPVKFQNPFGTCWGFAAIAAAETSILGSHFTYDPEGYLKVDFSEKQLAYFAHSHIDDPTSSQNYEGIYSTKYDIVDGDLVPTEPLTSEDMYTGGSVFLATNTFAAGSGPAQESRSEDLVYKGKNGLTIDTDDGTPYCYSDKDDWSLSEDYRFVQDYVLKESYFLPSPAVYDSDYVYHYNEAGTSAIKEQLLQKRAVEIGFHADTSRPWSTGYGQYMNLEDGAWAHYTYTDVYANHAVTIVGWDDNYSKDNFAHPVYQLKEDAFEYDPSNFVLDENGNPIIDEEATAKAIPPADGAWLVKNSWGSGEEEFPNAGGGDWGIPVQKTDAEGNPIFDEEGNPVMVGSGYFWISYYDHTFSLPEALVFDTSLTGGGSIYDQETLHRNQYDLMPVTAMQARGSSDLIKSANVFAPEAGEHVMCLSYITDTPNTTVSYEIYLLYPDFKTPEDGILVASGENTHEFAGFYVAYLDNAPIVVQPGQSYSVIVTQKQEDGTYAVDYPINYGPYNMLIYLEMSDYFAIAIQNDKESFIYSDGSWNGWSDEAARDEFLGYNEETGMDDPFSGKIMEMLMVTQYDNFPIKSYAFDKPEDINFRLEGEDQLVFVVGDEPTTVKLELYGEDLYDESLGRELSIEDYANEYGSQTITWTVAPGSEELISLMPSEDGTQATLEAKAAGIAYVIAKVGVVGGLGSLVIPIKIVEPCSMSDVAVTIPAQVYDDTAKTPEVSVSINGRELFEGLEYTYEIVAGPNFGITGEAREVGDYTVQFTGEGLCEGEVTAVFRIEHVDMSAYADLVPGAWYLSEIEGQGAFFDASTLYLDYTLTHGLMSGYRDDAGKIIGFGPDDALNRAQAAVVLYRMVTGDTDNGEDIENTTGLPDVEDGAYYTKAVNWAVESGVVTGYKDPETGEAIAFGPEDPVTREMIAVMAARLVGGEEADSFEPAEPLSYSDVDLISDWALSGVGYCYDKGIMTGNADGSFGPADSTLRAAMSKIAAVVHKSYL